MGLMDKMKKILFDEEEIVVPVASKERPVRETKISKEKEVVRHGVIDYHNESFEEDTIKEIKIPKEDIVEERREFKFPIDYDYEDAIGMRTRTSEYQEHPQREIINEEDKFHDASYQEIKTPEVTRDSQVYDVNKQPPSRKKYEEKDYHKIVDEFKEKSKVRKPFKVTPVISPVYGIIDKGEKTSELSYKRERHIIQPQVKNRTFGPVSYNDQPLPSVKSKSNGESLKEGLVEISTTISELIDDTVSPKDVVYDKVNTEPRQKKVKIDREVQEPIPNDEDFVIQTENYDDYESMQSSGIENEYIGNNNIEDAFESTSEFNIISEADSSKSREEIEDLIEHKDSIIDDDERLEDTIETDLFNLIDSMYKSDESEDNGED